MGTNSSLSGFISCETTAVTSALTNWNQTKPDFKVLGHTKTHLGFKMTDTKSLPIPPADEIHREHATVIIVGAGPVGLFLALKLAIKGVDVLVLEAEPTVLQSPRATT